MNIQVDPLLTSSWAVFKSLKAKLGGNLDGSRAGRVNTAGLGDEWIKYLQLSSPSLFPHLLARGFPCRLKCFTLEAEI